VRQIKTKKYKFLTISFIFSRFHKTIIMMINVSIINHPSTFKRISIEYGPYP